MATKNISRPYTVAQKLYVFYIIKGMLINLRRFFTGLVLQRNWTIQYPEERRDYSQRFRGAHFISVDKNKTENCTACFLCETVCPAECIHIVAEERPDDKNPDGVWKEKKPLSFDIDLLRCCFCGFCEEACPKDAIKLSRDYEMSVSNRDEAIFDLAHLKREINGRG